MLTLEYNSIERSFDDWGISRPVRSVRNRGLDEFSFDVDGDFLAVDSWPWGAKIIVRIERSGSGTSWTGGKIDFVGYRVNHSRGADAAAERRRYAFDSAWGFFFEQLTFQQAYKSWNNATQTNETLTRTQIVLGQAASGNRQGLNDQIKEIVSWVVNQTATEYGSPQIQLGDSYPDGWIPFDAINNITCGEALERCLSWIGGDGAHAVWIDYDTSPPTLHCKARSNLAAVSLEATGMPERLDIARRDNMIPAAVSIKYRVKVKDGANTYTRICEDIASEHGAGYTTIDGSFVNISGAPTIEQLRADALRFGAVVQTFDFEGPAINQILGTLTTVPFKPTSLAFWRVFCPELEQFDPTTLALVPNSDDGDLVTYSDPLASDSLVYAVTSGSVGGFMGDPALVQKVTVTACFSGTILTGDGRRAQIVHVQPKQIQIILTNVAGGTYYTSNEGEEIPFGLAAQVYAAETPAPYAGTYVLSEVDYSGRIGIGNVLNLLGGVEDWESMRALIQSVEIDYTEGRTVLTFGPAKHLGAGDLIKRLRAERGPRAVFYIGYNRQNNPNAQVIDLTVNGGSNSTSGHAICRYQSGIANQDANVDAGRYWLDALDRTLAVAGTPYTDETDPGDGQAVAKLGDITKPPEPSKLPDGVTLSDPLLHPELRKRNIALREVPYFDTDGKKYFQTVWASEKYSKSANDGTISGSGGGATQRLVITEVQDEYLVCKTFDNSVTGILVAKYDLYRNVWKSGQSTITILGTTYTLTPASSFYNSNNFRTCFDGSTSELQQLVPTYEIGGIVYPQMVDHTGVTVNDTEITLVEPDGRQWCYIQ